MIVVWAYFPPAIVFAATITRSMAFNILDACSKDSMYIRVFKVSENWKAISWHYSKMVTNITFFLGIPISNAYHSFTFSLALVAVVFTIISTHGVSYFSITATTFTFVTTFWGLMHNDLYLYFRNRNLKIVRPVSLLTVPLMCYFTISLMVFWPLNNS